MTVRLTVDRERWWNHVSGAAADIDNLVPVVKGNGYGFGREGLAFLAAKLAPVVAVGTIYELEGLPDESIPVVLTPTLTPPPTNEPILTVAAPEHVRALDGWGGRVIVKLTSSMGRYGDGISLVPYAQSAGLRTVGVSIHPPLDGDESARRADIERWLPVVDPTLDVWVSHLSPSTYAELPSTHRYHLRVGTYLWLGDRSAFQLGADVLALRKVTKGQLVGYRLVEVAEDGTLVMIGAGTANGVVPLDGGLSPFHYQRSRLTLIEAPHMHTSMAFVPDGEPAPKIGDWVDVQRPMTMTMIDELEWTE